MLLSLLYTITNDSFVKDLLNISFFLHKKLESQSSVDVLFLFNYVDSSIQVLW